MKSAGGEIKPLPVDERKSMEKLNKERYLRRVIVVCWIALAICFGIKLFGGNLFEIVCSNENFIKVCEYADTHFWADYLLYVSYGYVSMHFLVLAMIGKWKFTKVQLVSLILSVMAGVLVKEFNSTIGLVCDLWQGIILPIIFVWKERGRIPFVFLGNFLLIIFQLMSMFIKNIDIGIITDRGALMSTIFSIDIVIMILLYYLYSNLQRKEKNNGKDSYVVSM